MTTEAAPAETAEELERRFSLVGTHLSAAAHLAAGPHPPRPERAPLPRYVPPPVVDNNDPRAGVDALVALLGLGGRLAFELRHAYEWADLRQRLGLPSRDGRPDLHELLGAWESAHEDAFECDAFESLALLLPTDDDGQAAAAADPLEEAA